MIVKILSAKSSFNGVSYNTDKIDRDQGELMKVANFGPLQALGQLRPQDYINYLQLVSAQNNRISKPQFHAVISAKRRTYDKSALTKIAVAWLNEMGYGSQPYLIVFHKDTGNNHVHVVSTRVGKDGLKINSAFENVRALKNIRKVLGYDFGFQYRFSTRAQFLMLLENQGFLGIGTDEKKVQEAIARYTPDKQRAAKIKALFQALKDHPQFLTQLKAQHGIDLIFHAAEGKNPYGYSIIDHTEKRVFKGSEVMPLKMLLSSQDDFSYQEVQEVTAEGFQVPACIRSITITDDVDDQQVHGMKRKRQKRTKAR